MSKLLLSLTTLVLAGCVSAPCSIKPAVSSTQPSRLTVQMDSDGGLHVGGALFLQPSDLTLLAQEAGTDRPVVITGTDLQKLVELKHKFQSAGFMNVVIGPAVGE